MIKTPVKPTLTKVLSVAAVLGLVSFSWAQDSYQAKTLVMDMGVDLSHSKLKGQVNYDLPELNGQATVDDDNNGFVDDIAGWNGVSNDGIYMPDYILTKFTQNAKKVQDMLDIYTRVEEGDQQALRQLRQNPALLNQISELLELSHGTHVAGIISKNSLLSNRLQSFNVFNGSSETPAVTNPNDGSAKGIIASTFGTLKKFFDKKLFDNNVAAARKSFFDDRNAINKEITTLEKQQKAEMTGYSNYLKASQSRVVNLSLGSAKNGIRQNLEQMWAQELEKAGLPEDTKRNQVQETNFNFALDGVYNALRAGWALLFAENPNVLFVVAAGNDGEAGTDAGDLNVNPVAPADLSVDFRNVITIAATDTSGVLTDFSCYSDRSVNIAAWGKAVPSLAPGEHNVEMSGTSMAAPLVAGIATRVRAINPKLTAEQTRALIERTGKKLAALKGKVTTGALVDAQAAFAAAENSRVNVLELAISKARSGRRGSAAALSGNMLGLGGLNGAVELDTTVEGQLSLTNDVVKALLRKSSLF